jgi:Domain of unknown function (DUF4328)/Protein of unknown function (DUF2510)
MVSQHHFPLTGAATLRRVTTLPPPGWYRDPYAPALLRWWDGLRWAHDTRPMPGQVARPLSAPPTPAYLASTERAGRWAMLTWAPILVLYSALAGWALSSFLRVVVAYTGELSRAIEENRPEPPPPPPMGGATTAGVLLSAVGGLLLWIPLVLLVLWTYRSAVAAAGLGLPAEHEPAWAIAGWIVPVISFWFPYQSIRDCLPPGHQARRDVLRWWLGHLASGLVGPGLILLALAGAAAYVAGLVVLVALVAATTVFGLRVVRAIDEEHRKLLPQD